MVFLLHFKGSNPYHTIRKVKSQHFHEFFTQKIDNFHGKSKLNFLTKNEDFGQCDKRGEYFHLIQ